MKGKLEAQISLAATIIFTDDSANTENVVLTTAADYYINSAGSGANDLLAEFESQINDSGGLGGAADTIALSFSATTGKVTITFSGTSGEVDWNGATAFRDMLGFTQGNLTGAATYTGDDACKAVWLPDGHYQADYGTLAGWQEDDDQISVSPRGDVFELFGESMTVNTVTYPALGAAKAMTGFEVIANESFQSFRNNAMRKQVSCLTGKYRWHPDETDDATYYSYRGGKTPQHRPAPVRQNWTGLYAVSLERMYRDPDE